MKIGIDLHGGVTFRHRWRQRPGRGGVGLAKIRQQQQRSAGRRIAGRQIAPGRDPVGGCIDGIERKLAGEEIAQRIGAGGQLGEQAIRDTGAGKAQESAQPEQIL